MKQESHAGRYHTPWHIDGDMVRDCKQQIVFYSCPPDISDHIVTCVNEAAARLTAHEFHDPWAVYRATYGDTAIKNDPREKPVPIATKQPTGTPWFDAGIHTLWPDPPRPSDKLIALDDRLTLLEAKLRRAKKRIKRLEAQRRPESPVQPL